MLTGLIIGAAQRTALTFDQTDSDDEDDTSTEPAVLNVGIISTILPE